MMGRVGCWFGGRLKIFGPIALIAFTVMIPVNWSNNTLEHSGLTYSDIDKLSISNIPIGSHRYMLSHYTSKTTSSIHFNGWTGFLSNHMNCRFWTHLVLAHGFTFWTCYVLKREYEIVAAMRLHFLASDQRRPDQFTVTSISLTSFIKSTFELTHIEADKYLCGLQENQDVVLWRFKLCWRLKFSSCFVTSLCWYEGTGQKRPTWSRWISYWACPTFLPCQPSTSLSQSPGLVSYINTKNHIILHNLFFVAACLQR